MARLQRRIGISVLTAAALTGLACTGVVGLADASGAAAAGPTSPVPGFASGQYVVILKQVPAASYTGGVPGFARTAPRQQGTSFQGGSQRVVRYSAYLTRRQNTIARQFGVDIRQHYTVAMNGFAARLSAVQARQLSKRPDVLEVAKDTIRHVTRARLGAYATSNALGLTHKGRPAGNWKPSTAGKGVVVGVIDTGYWPESKSFAGRSLKHADSVSRKHPGPIWKGGTHKTRFRKADGSTFRGLCQAGEQFPGNTCNAKVISARYYEDGFTQAVPPEDLASYEFESPRDGGGHGSHTASTAAGDYGVPARVGGLKRGNLSGVAPAAKIAVYKVLWSAANPDEDGGTDSDIVAAIDQAVKDGVDVLNYSVGTGAAGQIIDPVSFAFLNAASAGVFVAASAGNDGPDASTVDNVSPWITTAAASTWRNNLGTVVLGNGKRYVGDSLEANGVHRRLVFAGDIAQNAMGTDGATAAECGAGTLDPAKARNKIVLCNRGASFLIDKSAEVKHAGGKGMILGNVSPLETEPILHSVPTVHVKNSARKRILRYINSAGDQAKATLLAGNKTNRKSRPIPVVADFSSRGPALAAGGDILKPDISAPGVAVLAAVAPPSNKGRKFDFYDGTSMASPHIAGLGAYYLGRHPMATPASIRSAVMTTASSTLAETGRRSRDAFSQGAGEVDGARFLDPGLTFPAKRSDWKSYLAGQDIDLNNPAPPIKAYNLNQPSIAVASVLASTKLTRTVKNMTGHTERYSATYRGSDKINVRFAKAGSFVKSRTYAVGGHQLRTLRIRVSSKAVFGPWAKGFISLRSREHVVRIPLVARPLALTAEPDVEGSGITGNLTVHGRSGFNGTVNATVSGLVGATPANDTVTEDGGTLVNADVTPFAVPSGSRLSRIDLDGGLGSNDLDLYLFANDGTPFNPGTDPLVAFSATASADEQILGRLPAGDYWVVVDGYDVTGAGQYTLTSWNLPAADAGNLVVTPTSQTVTRRHRFTVTGAYTGLNPGQVYFGRVTFTAAGTSQKASTVVTVRP